MYVAETAVTVLPEGGERVRRYIYPLVDIAAYLPFHRSLERDARLRREKRRLAKANVSLGLAGESMEKYTSKDPKQRYLIEKRDAAIAALDSIGTLASEDKLAKLTPHFRLVAVQLPQPMPAYRIYRRFTKKEVTIYVEELEGGRLGNPFVISPRFDREEEVIALLQDWLART